jgi:hypothetical protein
MSQKLRTWLLYSGSLQAILAGILLGIGFIVPLLWWLSLPALVWTLYIIKTVSSYKKLSQLLFITWWIKSLCSLSWYVSIYPIHWIDISSYTYQLVLLMVYWVTSSAWIALGAIGLAVTGRIVFLQKYFSPVYWYVAIPIVWLGSELLSGVSFTVFSFGPGSVMSSYFVSQGMVGYLLGTSSLGIWLAAGAGVYGLSIVIVSAASLLLFLLERNRCKYLMIFFLVVIVCNVWSAKRQQLYTSVGVTVIGVDTQFDAQLLHDSDGDQIKDTTLRTAVTAAIEQAPDYVLLPEDSRYLSSQYDSRYPNQAMSMFLFEHKNTKTILIDSGRYDTADGLTVLRASVFDGVSRKIWQFDKQYLVPQGEYIPYLYQSLFVLLGYGTKVSEVAQSSSYRPGPLLQTAALPPYMPGVLFCFESISPTGVPQLTQTRNLPFIAHPISHAWFHNPTILWQQLDVMLQIQARYSGVPIVSAGNMSTGKLYLPTGEIKPGVVVMAGDRYQLREFTF